MRPNTAWFGTKPNRGRRKYSIPRMIWLVAPSSFASACPGSSRRSQRSGSHGFLSNASRVPSKVTASPNGSEKPGSGIGPTNGRAIKINPRW